MIRNNRYHEYSSSNKIKNEEEQRDINSLFIDYQNNEEDIYENIIEKREKINFNTFNLSNKMEN
jgi:hypothetical protein